MCLDLIDMVFQYTLNVQLQSIDLTVYIIMLATLCWHDMLTYSAYYIISYNVSIIIILLVNMIKLLSTYLYLPTYVPSYH